MKDKAVKIEITHRTIIFTVLFLLGLYGLYLIRDILIGLFIAILLMTAFNPLVTWLERFKLPRPLAIWIVYVIFFGSLIAGIAAIIPPLINQTVALLSQIPLPAVTQNIKTLEIDLQDLQIIANQLNSIPKVLNLVFSAFSVVITIITLAVIGFYLLIERKNLHKHLAWLFGDHQAEEKAEQFIDQAEERIGGWVRGELTLMFIIGLLTYIGLRLLNINYALPLAILAGLLEIIPNVGPTVSSIPAIIVAYISFSFPMAIAVAALYALIQQVENNFIVPFIMRKAIGINPIITILLILIGFRLAGVGGAALSIPIFLIIQVTTKELYKSRTQVKKKQEKSK